MVTIGLQFPHSTPVLMSPIYDSLHFTLSEDTKAQLAKLLKSQKKTITVNLPAQINRLVLMTAEYSQLLTPHLLFMDTIQAAMFMIKKL